MGADVAPRVPTQSCNSRELFAEVKRISDEKDQSMIAFLLWCILFVLCWPVAVLALLLYPLVWLLLLPFRIVGFAVHGVLAMVWALVLLPARLLKAPFRLA